MLVILLSVAFYVLLLVVVAYVVLKSTHGTESAEWRHDYRAVYYDKFGTGKRDQIAWEHCERCGKWRRKA